MDSPSNVHVSIGMKRKLSDSAEDVDRAAKKDRLEGALVPSEDQCIWPPYFGRVGIDTDQMVRF